MATLDFDERWFLMEGGVWLFDGILIKTSFCDLGGHDSCQWVIMALVIKIINFLWQ